LTEVLRSSSLRFTVVSLAAAAFLSTAIAGGLGILLKKYAPVRGGATIIKLQEK
jgi:hypothetical protein